MPLDQNLKLIEDADSGSDGALGGDVVREPLQHLVDFVLKLELVDDVGEGIVEANPTAAAFALLPRLPFVSGFEARRNQANGSGFVARV